MGALARADYVICTDALVGIATVGNGAIWLVEREAMPGFCAVRITAEALSVLWRGNSFYAQMRFFNIFYEFVFADE